MIDPVSVSVHLLPALIPPGALKGGVAVVVDVLRATTVMAHALAAGCEAVIPCAEIDEALALAATLPPGSAILGGERGGLPIEGFDLGNSPASYTPELCEDRVVVMTTTNGTRAILASLEADRVFIGAFANLKATIDLLAVNVLRAHARPVHVVCSGTEGFISHEDTLLAGAIVWNLVGDWGLDYGNDEARLAVSHWKQVDRPTMPAAMRTARLAEALALGRGGRNVLRIGLGPDIEDAAAIDRFDVGGELHRDPLRILATRP